RAPARAATAPLPGRAPRHRDRRPRRCARTAPRGRWPQPHHRRVRRRRLRPGRAGAERVIDWRAFGLASGRLGRRGAEEADIRARRNARASARPARARDPRAAGASLAVRDTLDGVRGRVRLIGCPAEERGNGKVHLMKGGAFEGVDAALMYHPGDRDEIDPLMLAMVNLDVELLGKAAHAAAEPYDGVNALDGLVLGWNAMSALRLLVRSDSRIHGIITDGGKAANIIPDRAAARLMVRSPDNTYLAELRRRVLACFEGAAIATGAELRPMWSEVCEVVNTNRPLAEAFAENARTLGRTMQARRPSDTHGSTDMGNVTTAIPGIHPFLSITEGPVPGHSLAFTEAARTPRALETMRLAAKALAMTSLDVMAEPALLKRAKEAHDGRAA